MMLQLKIVLLKDPNSHIDLTKDNFKNRKNKKYNKIKNNN